MSAGSIEHSFVLFLCWTLVHGTTQFHSWSDWFSCLSIWITRVLSICVWIGWKRRSLSWGNLVGEMHHTSLALVSGDLRSDCRALPYRCERVSRSERRDGPGDRSNQRPLFNSQLVSHSIHLRLRLAGFDSIWIKENRIVERNNVFNWRNRWSWPLSTVTLSSP